MKGLMEITLWTKINLLQKGSAMQHADSRVNIMEGKSTNVTIGNVSFSVCRQTQIRVVVLQHIFTWVKIAVKKY